jgi:hypothetical protein
MGGLEVWVARLRQRSMAKLVPRLAACHGSSWAQIQTSNKNPKIDAIKKRSGQHPLAVQQISSESIIRQDCGPFCNLLSKYRYFNNNTKIGVCICVSCECVKEADSDWVKNELGLR